jgi:hypothetical protein
MLGIDSAYIFRWLFLIKLTDIFTFNILHLKQKFGMEEIILLSETDRVTNIQE